VLSSWCSKEGPTLVEEEEAEAFCASKSNTRRKSEKIFIPSRNCFSRDTRQSKAKPRQTTALSAVRPPRTSEPNMRSTRHSLANLFLVLVTLTLASSVDAKVRVRPVNSEVLLDGVTTSAFKSRDVQRAFCRGFTDSIGLNEKVRAREAPE
jgi:hypothetical protein